MSNMIINPYAFGGGAAVLGTISYISNLKVAASAATSFSFAGASIGAADATRRILITISTSNSVATRTCSSVTIAGVAATQLGAINGPSLNSGRIEIWTALVPSGTTGTIAGNFSGNNASCTIHVFRIINETSGTISTVGSTGTSSTLNSTVPVLAGGWCALVANSFGSPSPTNITFTGATQDINDVLGATIVRCNAAHDNNLPANAARPVSMTNVTSSSSIGNVMVAMSGT